MRPEIVLIGGGNLGSHLHKALPAAQWISSRTAMPDVQTQAGLYILAVQDRSIQEAADHLRQLIGNWQPLVVHTSGATPSSVLQPYFQRYGCFYPVQTFSKGREISFPGIPICVWTAMPDDQAILADLAQDLAGQAIALDDDQRLRVHLAAVMVNNFTNHLYYLAEKWLNENNIPFEVVKPLILETARKVMYLSPESAQTGPAARGDQPTIDRHLALLADQPDMRRLYEWISRQISERT